MMRCNHCKELRALDEFSPSFVKRGRGTCRACIKASLPRSSSKRAEWYKANRPRINQKSRERYARDNERLREISRAYYQKMKPKNAERWNEKSHLGSVRRKFGMSADDYGALLKRQGGGCACCGVTPEQFGRRLAVDHCHATGRVRGILCSQCNTGIGALGDNVQGVRRAAAYLLDPIPDSNVGCSAGLLF